MSTGTVGFVAPPGAVARWRSTGVTGHELLAGSEIDFDLSVDGNFILQSACNVMDGRLTGSGSLFTPDPSMATSAMGCSAPAMEQDDWLANVFGARLAMKVSDGRLVIMQKDVTLTFERTGPAETSVGTNSPILVGSPPISGVATDSSGLAGSSYYVAPDGSVPAFTEPAPSFGDNSFEGQSSFPPEELTGRWRSIRVTGHQLIAGTAIVFTLAPAGIFTAHAGCNYLQGNYTGKGSTVKPDAALVTTSISCSSEQEAQDSWLRSVFNAPVSITLLDSDLVMRQGKLTLTFTQVP